MKNEKELREHGCNLPINDFKDCLVELMHNLYRAFTIDRLVQNPYIAIDYCNVVRKKVACSALPDEFILRCLMNRRKNAG